MQRGSQFQRILDPTGRPVEVPLPIRYKAEKRRYETKYEIKIIPIGTLRLGGRQPFRLLLWRWRRALGLHRRRAGLCEGDHPPVSPPGI